MFLLLIAFGLGPVTSFQKLSFMSSSVDKNLYLHWALEKLKLNEFATLPMSQ